MLSDTSLAQIRERAEGTVMTERDISIAFFDRVTLLDAFSAALEENAALRDRLAAAEADHLALMGEYAERLAAEHAIGQAFVDRINELEQREQQARAIIEPFPNLWVVFDETMTAVQFEGLCAQARAWLAASEP